MLVSIYVVVVLAVQLSKSPSLTISLFLAFACCFQFALSLLLLLRQACIKISDRHKCFIRFFADLTYAASPFLSSALTGPVINIYLAYAIELQDEALAKLLTLAALLVNRFLFNSESWLELTFITLLSIAFTVTKEVRNIKLYVAQSKLEQILQFIPMAMCVVEQGKDQSVAQKISQTVAYANSQCETMINALRGSRDSCRQSDSKQGEVLEFLSSLQLEPIKNTGFQITDMIPQIKDEGITEDQFQIISVDYNNKQVQSINNGDQQSPQKPQSTNSFLISPRVSQSEFLTLIERSSFLANIKLQIKISHQPQSYAMSALTKRRKLSSNQFYHKLSNHSQRVVMESVNERQMRGTNQAYEQSSQNMLNYEENQLSQQINSSGYQQISKKPSGDELAQRSYTNHTVRLLINMIEMRDLLDDASSLKIYWINELSPVLLQHTVKQLEQVKKNLLRSISHELRTSLHAVKGHISQALESQKSHEGHQGEKIAPQNNIAVTLKYVELMEYKLQDFFDYRNILEKSLQLNKDYHHLRAIIDKSISLVADQCQKKRLYLDVDFPKEEICVYADQERLIQVLLNLLCNSIKFTQVGGIKILVTYSVMKHSDDWDQQHNNESHNYVEVRVCDSGIGMHEEQKGQLMMKLLQVDEDTKITKESVGVGVGLSVVKSIINLMGPQNMNSLFVDSNKGIGSQFYFYLQYKKLDVDKDSDLEGRESQYKKQSIRISPTHVKANGRKKTIRLGCDCNRVLLVDDEPFNQEILKNYLLGTNVEIDTAFNGIEALQQVTTKQSKCTRCLGYFLIIMDINMPIMNGWDCAKNLRKFEKQLKTTIRTEIVALTGFSDKKDQEKCLRQGFDQVLLKPISKAAILQLLKKRLK